MTRQLNVRVNDEFVKSLERISRLTGRTMSSVLETLGAPVLEEAEADLRFEEDALKAWEEYQLTGDHVTAEEIGDLFKSAQLEATKAAKERS